MGTFIYFSEEQKQRANSVDLVEFLKMQGETLIPSGREKLLLITNVVPLLLGTFAETCSLNLPQKGRKAGHDCLWAVA